MSKNVYQIGSGELTFEIIERIINENLKLELAPEAKLRIQKCRDYLDHKIASSEEPFMASPPASARYALKIYLPANWEPCRKT